MKYAVKLKEGTVIPAIFESWVSSPHSECADSYERKRRYLFDTAEAARKVAKLCRKKNPGFEYAVVRIGKRKPDVSLLDKALEIMRRIRDDDSKGSSASATYTDNHRGYVQYCYVLADNSLIAHVETLRNSVLNK
jgi:hypothetical protein